MVARMSYGILLLAVALQLLFGVQAKVVKVYNFSGTVDYDSYDHVFVPFAVPAGVKEIEIGHQAVQARGATPDQQNILDFGVLDERGNPDGYRGWSGGSGEASIIGALATSRAFTLGPINAGTWNVVIGKAQIAGPPNNFGEYKIQVILRDAPTLPAQTERQPYRPSPPLATQQRWYAGDFHIHSRESTDAFATATLDAIAAFARHLGLDFAHISDHNTISQGTFMVDAQTRHPDLLLIPGIEWTTYFGHGGCLGCTKFVDHKINLPGVNITVAAQRIHAQGGLFSINHEDMYMWTGVQGNKCIGCVWDFVDAFQYIDAYEVGIQGWNGIGFFFSPDAVERWDHLHALGYTHIAPIGGSDDHHAGLNESKLGPWEVGSPIGSPTTMVFADNLSHQAIIGAIAQGRTYVKMVGPYDPNVDFYAQCASGEGAIVRVGSTVAPSFCPGSTPELALYASITQLKAPYSLPPLQLCLVRNNMVWYRQDVAYDAHNNFNFSARVKFPRAGTDRWRLDIRLSEASVSILPSEKAVPRIMTNHMFLKSQG